MVKPIAWNYCKNYQQPKIADDLIILVNYPRWCKLRGNLLFYLKNHEPNSQPAGLLVLENCRPIIKTEEREFDGYSFILGT